MNKKVGVIGFGKMGKLHAMAYAKIGHRPLIFDKFKIENNEYNYTNDFDYFIKNCDIVSICSPTSYHFEHLKILISNNKNILVEKPICSNIEQTLAINELLKKHKTKLSVGFIERFNPAFCELLNHIKNNNFKLKNVTATRTNPSSGRIVDADIVVDLAVHDIDLVLLLCGFLNYTINGVKYTENNNMKDEIDAKLQIGGTNVNLITSRISDKSVREIKIETVCGKTITCDLLNKKLISSGQNIEIIDTNPIVDEIQSFINLCENLPNNCTNIFENIMVMQLTDELSKYK